MSDPRSRPHFTSNEAEEAYWAGMEDDYADAFENSVEHPEDGLLSNLPHDD